MKYFFVGLLFLAPAIHLPPSERCITDQECEDICLTDEECAQINREYEIAYSYSKRG